MNAEKPCERHPRTPSRRGFLALAGATAAAGMTGASSSWSYLHAAESSRQLQVRREEFGKAADGTVVDVFTLSNDRGLEARVMTYGATLLTLKSPDRAGKSENITLYLDSLEEYLRGHPLFGSVVGRFANRIAGAKFTIDGTEHKLTANAGPHHIHGGRKGAFHALIWKAQRVEEKDSVGVKLTHVSPDGTDGYPGTVEATVTYRLTADQRLIMEYTARTDKPTHVNLTNHAYWNLAGAGSGDVLGHRLLINADHYLVADAAKIPTGERRRVDGTAMDFRALQPIGSRIEQVEDRNYDHCYVLNKPEDKAPRMAARVVEPKTGRTMEVRTTQPGVQLYSARGLSDRMKAGGKTYGPYHGFCLETQHFPDAPNKPEFPSTLLRPGETYRQTTTHTYGIE